MSSPLSKLEKIVYDALIARGMSDGEANVTIRKLKNSNQFPQKADIEVSADGRLVALSPCIAVGFTGKALCVEWRGQTMWIPFNQIDAMSEVHKKDDCGILVITKWIAEKKGLVRSDGSIPTP